MKTLIIIDGNALVHRAFHALPELTTKKGEIVNAVYGFLLGFFKVIKELHPDYLAATFDTAPPTFRHKIFKEYKATRKKAPQSLYDQIPKIKDVLNSFDVSIFEKPGFEADDLIATISERVGQQLQETGVETYILTGDLDALQLVNKNIKVYTFSKGIKAPEIYGPEKVKKRFELLPAQIIDFKALAGDASDNIPGASGIGKKTATELLKEYKNIKNLYQSIEKGEAWDIKSKTRAILLKHKDDVFLSYELAKADRNVPIDFNLEKCQWIAPSLSSAKKEKVSQVLRKYDFYSLISKIP